MAMFTYQLAYWGWVKLEQDEIRAEREGEFARRYLFFFGDVFLTGQSRGNCKARGPGGQVDTQVFGLSSRVDDTGSRPPRLLVCLRAKTRVSCRLRV